MRDVRSSCTLHNLRQSAVTDAEHNPGFIGQNVSDWFGNAEKTRQKHDSRTLAEDVKAANEGNGRDLAWMDKNDFVHDLFMKATEMAGDGEGTNEETPEFSGVFSGVPATSEEQGGPNWTRTALKKHRRSGPAAKSVHDLSILAADSDRVSHFRTLLQTEYGFSADDVAKILAAAERVGLQSSS